MHSYIVIVHQIENEKFRGRVPDFQEIEIFTPTACSCFLKLREQLIARIQEKLNNRESLPLASKFSELREKNRDEKCLMMVISC